jgi:hypothetical protein
MNSPIVTLALDKNANGTNSGCSRIGFAANALVDIVDNVAGYFSISRASIAINASICRTALVGEQAIFTSLMIADDVIANDGAKATLRILDAGCSGAAIRCSSTLRVLNRITLNDNIPSLSQVNGLMGVVLKRIVTDHGILHEVIVKSLAPTWA